MPGPALVVGLGNPGPEYERTRHNLGFRVIDVLADRLGARVKPAKGMRALVAEARDGDARIILAKPTTFMNASGAAVSELARYYKVDPRDVVIVHDELDLPVAQLKVKRGGGDAGKPRRGPRLGERLAATADRRRVDPARPAHLPARRAVREEAREAEEVGMKVA